MLRWLSDRINIWVVLGALAVAGAMTVLFLALVYFIPVPARAEQASVILTRIPGPTPTPTPPPVTPTPTATVPVTIDGISIGQYVQISGTEGQGLRIRSGPGTSHPPRFLGMDSEVFLVKDGPSDSDGFTWWFLEAPYDPDRSGWAASSYLSVVNQP
jgi:hypothetical protein